MKKLSTATKLRMQQRAAEQSAHTVAKLVTSGHKVTQLHDDVKVDLKSYLAYRVKLTNGTMVLCRTHLEQVREEQEPNPVKLTGETFGAGLCDRCHPEAQ